MLRSLVVVTALAGCGRLGFDDSATPPDVRVTDAPLADAVMLDPALVVLVTFDDDPTNGLDNTGARPALRPTCVEVCPPVVAGIHGNALAFSATTDGLMIPDDPALRVATGTVAAWVRFDAFPEPTQFMMIAGKRFGAAATNTWELMLRRGDALELTAGGDAGDPRYAALAWTTGLGIWTHVAVTWDATTTRLYRDGVMLGDEPVFAASYDDGSVYLGIDRDGDTLKSRLVGALDDLRIYDRALAASEIAALAVP